MVEGFSTQWSNKRTAGLPNPHPVGLQSCCSILPGFPPLGWHQTTDPQCIHPQQDPHLLGHAGSMSHWDTRPSAMPDPSPSQIHTPPGYLPLCRDMPQPRAESLTTRIPPQLHWTPALSQTHSLSIQVKEAFRTPNRLDQNRTTPWHIIIETTSTETRERILNTIREKKQITYKGKPIKITADFSMETLKVRRAWNEEFWALNENNFNPRILYPEKLPFKIHGTIKVIHDKRN
jgi:hypothetical protein